MATLNTLRTRGGVIVSIVIGIALLAFLLGDLSSAGNMMNARKMRVGEIDGNKIGYLEYTEPVSYTHLDYELQRGGQVYFVHNKVETIDTVSYTHLPSRAMRRKKRVMSMSIPD